MSEEFYVVNCVECITSVLQAASFDIYNNCDYISIFERPNTYLEFSMFI